MRGELEQLPHYYPHYVCRAIGRQDAFKSEEMKWMQAHEPVLSKGPTNWLSVIHGIDCVRH